MAFRGQEPAGQESFLPEIIVDLREAGIALDQGLEFPGLERRADRGLEGQEGRAGVAVPDRFPIELVLELEGELPAEGEPQRGRQVVRDAGGLEIAIDRRHAGRDPVQLPVERPAAGLVDPRTALDLVGEPVDELEPISIAGQGGLVRGQRFDLRPRTFGQDAQVLLAELEGDGRPDAALSDPGVLGGPGQRLAIDRERIPEGRIMACPAETVGFGEADRPIDTRRRRSPYRGRAGGVAS